MDAIVAILEQLRSIAGTLGENRIVIYIITLIGLAVLFILRAIGKRFADDVYDGLKAALRSLLGIKSKKKGDSEGPDPTLHPAHTSDDATIRTKRHQYKIGESIAQGNLAMLHAGTDETGASVVLKIAANPDDNDLLRTESRILSLMSADSGRYGKHLPELLDQFHTTDGRQGNVLGHLNGHDLISVRQKYKDGVPERHIIWIFRRSLSVLGFAHSKGIIHGNIEPSHIMVRAEDHNVWLIDWCYAIFEPARTGQGFVVANEVYSAPEVSQRKPPLPSADLFSLGLSMIYLIGGDPAARKIPDHVNEELRRFMEFFVLDSPLGRAQDAWEMYNRLDELRKRLYGEHEFIPFEM